jgi:hypothetical protein
MAAYLYFSMLPPAEKELQSMHDVRCRSASR